MSGFGRGAGACAHTDYDDGSVPEGYPRTGADATGLEREVWDALREVQDPEMPVSVVDLGLIYGVEVDREADGGTDADRGDGEAEASDVPTATLTVEMTLTYTGCPARDVLTNDVRCAAESVPAVASADVELRYTPEWTVEMVTPAGRERLREFGLSV